MKGTNRKADSLAKEVIASILLFEIADPRLELVTLTSCKVSHDRAYCDVYYTVEPKRYNEVSKAFEASSGHIRSLMAQRLGWRKAPVLRFHLDETIDVASKLEDILDFERSRLSSPDEEDVSIDSASNSLSEE